MATDATDERDLQMADPQVRVAALNAAVAMGVTNPRKACEMAEKLMDWIVYGDLPNPYPGETWS